MQPTWLQSPEDFPGPAPPPNHDQDAPSWPCLGLEPQHAVQLDNDAGLAVLVAEAVVAEAGAVPQPVEPEAANLALATLVVVLATLLELARHAWGGQRQRAPPEPPESQAPQPCMLAIVSLPLNNRSLGGSAGNRIRHHHDQKAGEEGLGLALPEAPS